MLLIIEEVIIMAGTSEGAKKAAAERKEKDPEAFKKMGREGGLHSHGGTGKSEKEGKKESGEEGSKG